MVYEIFVLNCYNPPDFAIKSDDVVIDIGANLGVFTIFAARKTKNKVFSFEPFSENVKKLKDNLEINAITNVIYNEIAVTDKIGYSYLTTNGTSAGLYLTKKITTNNGNFAKISTTSLSDIFDKYNLKNVGFLKMDCEGSEGIILHSTPERYLRKINKIVIEFHDNRSELNHNEIIDLLKNLGFHTEIQSSYGSNCGLIYAKQKNI